MQSVRHAAFISETSYNTRVGRWRRERVYCEYAAAAPGLPSRSTAPPLDLAADAAVNRQP
ncbi:MAG TPA: hypothetical protein VLZ05_20310 [Mycobacterium sp.]|nr:hypothetical protein [Mycobacterium sp.]HUH71007.1 hypothetical protein [Mycobacterium sp.]